MNEYSEECLVTFLKNQEQLFAEPVAETCLLYTSDAADEL